MWWVIRLILLLLAVGRRIHPSIGEFKRFNDQSKDFRKRRGSPAPGGGGGGAAQGPSAASENPSTDRWFAWIRQLKDGFDGQLPVGEESIE